MKSILLFIFSFSLICSTIGQQVLVSENFDSYSNNQGISVQSPFISTWSTGSVDDALVSQDQANSGTQSIKIDDSSGVRSDLIVPLNNIMSGTVDVAFQMYVPEQFGGYFNIQKSSTPGVEWAFEVFIGEEAWQLVGGDTIVFDFPLNTWNEFSISINLDSGSATLSLNDDLINTWPWASSIDAITGLNQVGSINLFAGSPFELPPLSYIDDISATFSADGSVSTKGTSANDNISIYPNPANSYLDISIEEVSKATLEIINSAGKTVLNKILNSSQSTIDINSLEAGFYIVKFNDGVKSTSKKLIIQ